MTSTDSDNSNNKQSGDKDQYEHVTTVALPPLTPFNPDDIPDTLTSLPRWVLWSLVHTTRMAPDAKPAKRPIRLSSTNPHGPGIDVARWSTPDRQYTFKHCLDIYNQELAKGNHHIHGLGFIPHPDDSVVVIDYDALFDTTAAIPADDPRAALVQRAATLTWVEYSQSGKGAHVYLIGHLAQRHNDSASSGVEMYPGKKQSFIAVTGRTYGDAPNIVNDGPEAQALIDDHLATFFNKSNRTDDSSSDDSSTDDYTGYVPPDHIPNGNRNNEMTRLCGWLFSRLGSLAEVAAEMFRLNQELCETPLSTEELQTIINSISQRQNSKHQHLIDDIWHIRATDTWYDFKDNTELTANSLNISHIKEFPGKKDTRPHLSKWLAKQPGFNEAADFTWLPLPHKKVQRSVIIEGRRLLNTWRGFAIEPVPGTVQPWLTHLAHVVPEENYRRALLWWIAFTIQQPDVKCHWQPVILGISGAGKDALFRPIANILGNSFKSIGNKDIKGDYDDGLYQTKLLHISEARGLSGNAIEFYKRITAVESSENQMLNIKCHGKVVQRNICNVVVITNNLDAMKFDHTERRPLVLSSPKVMSGAQQVAYFDKWLDRNGSAHLFDYLLSYDLSEFKHSIRPYRTVHFDRMFDMTQSDMEVSLYELLCEFDIALPQHLKHMVDGKDSKRGNYDIAAIQKWLQSNGWKRWDDNDPSKKINKKIDGIMQTPKSRLWHVRAGSRFDGCSAKDMFDEVERVEEELTKRHKF